MTKNILISAAKSGVPGSYAENFSIAGFSIVSTDGSFQIGIGNEQAQTFSSGQSIGAATGPALGRVTFLNPSATPINVTIGDYGSARATAISTDAGTFVGANSGLYDFGSAGTGDLILPGVDSQGRARRLVYITNSGRVNIGGVTTSDVLVCVVNGKASLIVFPGMTEPIETNADITISSFNANLSGGPTHLIGMVLEIFNSKPLQTDQ